ncbi:hypothetical protein LWI29_008188 [Acer saccharum]|uniref:Uncharacterized protein n=1 Tax=Acer saccharum TaxID=4024 RepID=A0AA39RGP8_ACESA|nr:hypothetical protein LWI29_008188 [Acer saccharum]
MAVLLLTVCGLVMVWCLCFALLKRNQIRRYLPPGTMGWPFFGETTEFLKHGPNFMKNQRARYGSLFKSHILGCPTVVSMDPVINRYILMNEGKGLVPGYPQSMLEILGKNNIAAVHGATHKYIRGSMLSLIGPASIRLHLLSKIDMLLRSYLDNWDGKTIDIQERTNEGRKRVTKLLRQIMEERRASSVTHNDMLDEILRNEDSNCKLSDVEIIDQVIAILYSGYETVSTTTMMAIKYLHDHPRALQELRDEHFAMRQRKKPDEPIDWNDYKSMNFTRSVIYETSRLATIVNGVLRKTTKDIELNGFIIPEGWRIYVYTREINYDPFLYPEPFTFNPWRWLSTEPHFSLPTSVLSVASSSGYNNSVNNQPNSSSTTDITPPSSLAEIPALPFHIDLSSNQHPSHHPMVTRLRSEAIKPRAYSSICQPIHHKLTDTEPKSVKEALGKPHWHKAMAEEYGSLFKSHILGSPMVVSMDPEINRYILMNEGKGLVPGYPQSMVEIVGKNNIAAVHGATHKYIRGSMLSLIGPASVRLQLLSKIDMLLRSYLDNWDGKTIDIQERTKEMALLTSFKPMVKVESNQIYETFKTEFDKLVVGTLSLPINILGSNYHYGLQGRKRVIKFLRRIMEERRASSVTQNDMLDELIGNEDSDYKLNDVQIIDQVITILYSGYESVSKTTMMAIKYLHDHPRALEQLRDEHFAIRQRKKPDEPIDWNDYKSMSFTRAVIYETSRLATIINGVMRKTTKDVELNGFIIPKGWRIYVYTREINYDPFLYPEPFTFNPWRWLDNKSLESHNYCFLFGGGTRLCPGKELGIVKITMFLHYFVTRYRWEEVGGEKLVQFPRVEAPNGLHIRVSKY